MGHIVGPLSHIIAETLTHTLARTRTHATHQFINYIYTMCLIDCSDLIAVCELWEDIFIFI